MNQRLMIDGYYSWKSKHVKFPPSSVVPVRDGVLATSGCSVLLAEQVASWGAEDASTCSA